MSSAATLCIVDMQPYFYASQESWLIENVIREINEAKQHHAGILLIEYKGCGDTDSRILQPCLSYPLSRRIVKQESDAAPLILDTSNKCNFNTSHFIITGVETATCITDTINGLTILNPDVTITVVADAVNMLGRTQYKKGFKGFYRKRQITIKNRSVRIPVNEFV